MNTSTIATKLRHGDPGRGLVLLIAIAAIWGPALSAPASEAAERPTHPESEDCEACYRLDVIVIEGLLRTDRDVVERELMFEEGDVATVEEVEESVQRLRNTGIFRRVDYELSDRSIGARDQRESDGPEDRGRLLRLTVDERYTISPRFRLSQGGDTLQLTLGLQDVNIGGSFLQGGVTYRRLGSTNSFSAWFREPRFLGARQRLRVGGGINSRLYTLYDEDGDIEGGYLQQQRDVSVSFDREWRRWWRNGIEVSFADDLFGYDLVDDRRREAQEQRGGLYPREQTLTLAVRGRLGKVDTFEYRRVGTSLSLRAEQRFHFGEGEPRSRRFNARFHHFHELPFESTLATRAEVGFRPGAPSYRHFFAGGLDTVRGTFDNRYRGPHHWLTNLELRVPTYKNDWLIVQNVAFFDAVRVADEPGGVTGLTAATTGLGLRLISRDFYGMVVRLDYAPPILDANGPGLSFGAGQFF